MAIADCPTDARSLAGDLRKIVNLLRNCITRSGVDGSALIGIAIGFCGIVDAATGEILSTLNKYPDAPTIDLRVWAFEHFQLSILVENDACLALLGEWSAGAARGSSDVVMVTLGTGIGGAAMLGGRLLRSYAGQAGCLGGHLPVNYRGRRCGCGAIGCAEAEASTAVLPLLCHEQPDFGQSLLANESVLDFQAIFHASDAGDIVASRILNHCLQVWSALAVGLVHAYGPQVVVFGGGVMARAQQVLDPIREYVEAHMWRTSRGVPRLVAGQLGPRAALLGGAALFDTPQTALPQARRTVPA